MIKVFHFFVLCFIAIIIASCNTQPKENKPGAQQATVAKQADSIAAAIVSSPTKDTVRLITKTDSTQAWVDSLDAIVKKGFRTYTDQAHYEKQQVTFIKASAALGEYYTGLYLTGKLPNLNKAMHYYESVTMFREETDSELGENEMAIKERNKLCKKVAALYDKGLLPADKLKSIYVGHYVHPKHILLSSVFKNMSDSTGPTIRFIAGSAMLTKSAMSVLDKIYDELRADATKNIVVSSGGSNTEIMQQVCWEQTNSVMTYLIEREGVSRERIFFRYNGREEPSHTTLRFAKEGETGESTVAPPHPGFMTPE